MTNIGIIGQGFVGSAVKAGLETEFKVLTYDKFIVEKTNSTLLNIVDKCEVIFVCVPTPMDMSTGECHTGIVESVIQDVDRLCIDLNVVPTLVVKSTVPPGTIDSLNDYIAQHCNVTFNPEFLTEANAVSDFINQNRIVLGGDKSALRPVVEIFESAFPGVPIKITSASTAEMIKYTTNCFLATKVSFANEIYDICKGIDVDYNEMIEISKLDTRLGSSHWMVPGPDGDRGYGGHCFPKDMTALRYVASTLSVDTPTINGASLTNSNVRKDLDWESQEGRAVIHTNKI